MGQPEARSARSYTPGRVPSPAVPPTPVGASLVFGPRLPLAEAYVRLLADTGISHGLIGPREAPRLWDRHLLNSAVIADLFSADAAVADIGSGAGLPGIPLAIARPDLQLTLVEPLKRRVLWLQATIAALDLTNVSVHSGRAETLWGADRFAFATARAVAATAELARITLPLLDENGALHALKGDRAEHELTRDQAALTAMGAVDCRITRWGAGLVEPETVVLSVAIGLVVNGRTPASAQVDGRRSDRRRPGPRLSRGR